MERSIIMAIQDKPKTPRQQDQGDLRDNPARNNPQSSKKDVTKAPKKGDCGC